MRTTIDPVILLQIETTKAHVAAAISSQRNAKRIFELESSHFTVVLYQQIELLPAVCGTVEVAVLTDRIFGCHLLVGELVGKDPPESYGHYLF